MLRRIEVLKALCNKIGDKDLIICMFGHAANDLLYLKDRPENFYMRGGMGLASSIGLGLALTVPNRRVIVIDGDGSILMNLGSFATIARYAPKNLIHIILDNESHYTAGDLPTATASKTDLAAVARGAGIENSLLVKDISEFDKALDKALSENGPHVIVAKVARESAMKWAPPKRLVYLKERFMRAINPDHPNLPKL
ncbi:MAG: thiamine pyrophosphate-dependent enzyme [Nitrososphaerales archaeon]